MSNELSLTQILAKLPEIREKTLLLREIILANLVMIGETPAPTFYEEHRVRLLNDRFLMSGLDRDSTDDIGNALGILPGQDKEKGNILLVAHADSLADEKQDHTVLLQPETVTGVSLSNNALGLAVLASLPHFLEALNIQLNHSLIFMGAVRSQGKGNHEGLRFFLDNAKLPISYGMELNSLQLGNMSHHCIGMLRGEIIIEIPKERDWPRYGTIGAIRVMSEIIARIKEIPLPRKPRTSIILGSARSGNTYNIVPTKARIRFEIRSETAEWVETALHQMEEIIGEVASANQVAVKLEPLAKQKPGGIAYSHPLTSAAREIHKSLEIETSISPSASLLSVFAAHNIPALAVGITLGNEESEATDTLQIAPIFTGITQIIGLLLAIDNGHCAND